MKKLVAEMMPTPSGRIGMPDDIANAIAFLVSPASGQVNGVNIMVNGGGQMQ